MGDVQEAVHPPEQTAETVPSRCGGREVNDGSSRPTLDTLRFWSRGRAWVTEAKRVLLVFG